MKTLKYVRVLEIAGFSRNQAEKTVGVLQDAMDSNFATKQDLTAVEKQLRFEIQQAKSDLTIRIGAMIASAIAIITALDKLI